MSAKKIKYVEAKDMWEKLVDLKLKIRTKLIIIIILLIIIPITGIGIFAFYQLSQMEKNLRFDTESSLQAQLEAYLDLGTKHQIDKINHYFKEVSNKVYKLSLIATDIYQNPDQYSSNLKWDFKKSIFKDKEGRYTNSSTEKVNVFLPNYVNINEELIKVSNAFSFLDDLFEMEYISEHHIGNIYLLLSEPLYLRIYPNKQQSLSYAPDYKIRKQYYIVVAGEKRNKNVKTLWVPLYYDWSTKEYVASCIGGVFSKDDYYKGAVGVDLSVNNIVKEFSSYYMGMNVFTFIIDAQGQIIADDEVKKKLFGSVPERADIKLLEDKLLKKFLSMISMAKRGIDYYKINNEEMIFSYAQIPETNWKMVLMVSKKEINKRTEPIISNIKDIYRKMRIIWGVLLLLSIYLSVSVVLRISKNIVQPVMKISEASKKLEKGEIPEQILIDAKDEIGDLANSFNNLVKSLVQREEDIYKVQNFLRSIIRNSPDLIIVVDANNKIIEFNRAAEMLLGYSKNDVVGFDLNLFFYEARHLQDILKQLEEKNRVIDKEVSMIAVRGQKREILLSAAAICEEEGKIKEMIYMGKDITEKKEKEKELVKRIRQLEMLHKTIFTATASLDLDYLFQTVARTIQETFLYHSVEIYLLDISRQELIIYGKAGPYKYLIPENNKIKISEGIVGLVARTGETYVCQNIKNDPYYVVKFIPFTYSELSVPIKSGDDIIGVLNIEESKIDAFDAQDVLTMEAISAGIYSSIKNIELYKKLQRRINELTILYDFSKGLMSSLNMEQLIDNIFGVLREVFHYSNASIWYLNEQDNKLYLRSFYGYPNEYANSVRELGEGIVGITARDKKVLVLPDVSKNPYYIAASDKIKSEVSIPLIYGDKVIGVLDVESDQLDFFKEDEINMLTSLATQIAIAMDNVSLYKRLEETNVKLKESFVQILKALTAAIEAKDSYTDGHVQRTSMYAELVAKEMNLPNDMIEVIKYASILHDIGKIGIPESILQKPGKLTEEERKIMQKHPEIGVNIIKGIEFLKEAIPAIMFHQERYDGNTKAEFPGYPNGLKEDNIPIGAHIIAVVDAYDAMTSDRPYRKALSYEEAVKILLQEKGKQFHPQAVDALLKVLEKIKVDQRG